MRAIRMTCATALLTIATVIPFQTAAAAPCADFFPFICLFGPEAQAMEPSAPVTTEPAPAPAKPRKKRAIARKMTPMQAEQLAVIMEMESEAAPKADAAQAMVPTLSYGPGPAFAMSVRIAPSMLEQIMPRNSACMVEQTFNDLFRLAPGPDNKLATLESEPLKPMALLAIKTGTNGLGDDDDGPEITQSIRGSMTDN